MENRIIYKHPYNKHSAFPISVWSHEIHTNDLRKNFSLLLNLTLKKHSQINVQNMKRTPRAIESEYLSTHLSLSLSLFIYIYIYIYTCVCVCVCYVHVYTWLFSNGYPPSGCQLYTFNNCLADMFVTKDLDIFHNLRLRNTSYLTGPTHGASLRHSHSVGNICLAILLVISHEVSIYFVFLHTCEF